MAAAELAVWHERDLRAVQPDIPQGAVIELVKLGHGPPVLQIGLDRRPEPTDPNRERASRNRRPFPAMGNASSLIRLSPERRYGAPMLDRPSGR